MILVLSGTNRPNSYTRKVAEYIYDHLIEKGVEDVCFFSLEDLPSDILNDKMYTGNDHSDQLIKIQEEIIIPADRWIIVSPEYNGSFPGILKMFIDTLSVRKYAENFKNKRGALVGVASGRAGNLRGMEQLTGFLNYLGMHIHPSKLPISSIKSVLDENEEPNVDTRTALENLLKDFLEV